MDINELENFRITDAINFNDSLNPQLYLGDKMRPIIQKRLMKIADNFREFLGVGNIALIDITLTGSNAAYSYTPHSDIDLHLIVDFSQLPANDVYRELFDAKKYQYNDQHNIKVKGYDVELYVQDSTQVHHSLGNYSIMHNNWNRFPSKVAVDVDEEATFYKYHKLKNLAIRALASDSEVYLNKVLDIVKRYRQAGLSQNGEFGPENLAFKLLRKDGYFSKLWEKKRQWVDVDLSFEDAESDIRTTIEDELIDDFENFGKTLPEDIIKKMFASRDFIFDEFDYDYIHEAATCLSEAEYAGNIGVMEVMKFYQTATREQIELHKRLIDAGKTNEAWALVQKFTNTHLQGDQFNEDGGTKVKNPLTQNWKFFQSTKEIGSKYVGQYMSANTILGVTSINGEQVLWDPFSEGKHGLFYKVSTEIPGLKPIAITNDDIAAGFLYIRWDKAPKSKRADIAAKFLQLNISKQFKKVPRNLYRGFALTPIQEKKLKAGKRIKLDQTIASSWTTTTYNAKTFTGAKQGAIIKKQFKLADVICHLEALDEFFKLPLSDRWMAENEVLIKGNGLGNYLDPKEVSLEFTNFYAEDKVNEGVGIIVKDVNTTADVDVNSTKREAAKLGFDVTTGGVPPLLKGASLYESIVTEGTDNLYHFRRISSALKILTNKQFELSTSIGNPAETELAINKYQYFLSTSRSKVGSFHSASSPTGVIFNLDGRWVNQRYPTRAVNYWSGSSSPAGESEDRIYSKEPTIPTTPIQSIHVLHDVRDADLSVTVRKVMLAAKKQNIPIYLYNNKNAWLTQDTRKALSVAEWTAIMSKNKTKSQRTNFSTRSKSRYLDAWIELYHKKNLADLGNIALTLISNIRSYPPSDTEDSGLGTDISNAAKPGNTGRESAVTILQIMRKERWQTPVEFAHAMMKKWKPKFEERYQKERAEIAAKKQATTESLSESIVNELNMAPGNLKKHVNSILLSADPVIGLEFEVCIAGDEGDNPKVDKHTTRDDILEFFSENSEEDFSGMDELHQEWIDEKQQEWVEEQVLNAANDPRVETEKKLEILEHEYVLGGDAEMFLEKIDATEITEEIAKEILEKATEAYRKHGSASAWPVDSNTNPYIALYYEVFINDTEESETVLRDHIQDDFYSTEMSYNDTDYSIGTYLNSILVSTMSQIYQEWPRELYWYGAVPGDESFDADAAQSIASDLEDIVGDEVFMVGGEDPSIVDTSKHWSVTNDSSIKPNDEYDAGMEIVTPVMPYIEGLEHIENVVEYLLGRGAYANETTALHINISLRNVDHSKLDYAKLVLMAGDAHILKQFKREFNEFALNSIDKMAELMDARQGYTRDQEATAKGFATMLGKMRSNFNHVVGNSFDKVDFGKFASIGIKDNRIEFRSVGGKDYLHNMEEINAVINRFIVAYAVAADPEAYKKEYGKKLYKLANKISTVGAEKNALTLFAAFNSGILGKEDLIRQLKSKRAEPEVDVGEPEPTNDLDRVGDEISTVDTGEPVVEANSYQAPKIDVGDEVKVGKFKNRKAIVKGFEKDKDNQPVLKTDKGDHKLFKPRISKLEGNKQK